MTRYTLAGPFSHEEDIRRSRFLALADRAQNPQQALAFINAHSIAEATHNCWAYQIGDEYRFNDDGEPGGTAGRPILQAIQGQQCDQVVVLVIRWFGGTKLGTGGLIRAYGGSAAQCLRRAAKVELIKEDNLWCFCPFPDLSLVQSRFDAYRIRVLEETFDAEGVCWKLAVPAHARSEFSELFMNQTRGQGRLEDIPTAESSGDGQA